MNNRLWLIAARTVFSPNGFAIEQVQLLAGPGDEGGVALRLKLAGNGAASEAAMAGDKDSLGVQRKS